MKFKVGDVVKIKDRDNPNNWPDSHIKIVNEPMKITEINPDFGIVHVHPPIVVYEWDKISNKWKFSVYNSTLGIHVLEHAMLFKLDSKLFEI